MSEQPTPPIDVPAASSELTSIDTQQTGDTPSSTEVALQETLQFQLLSYFANTIPPEVFQRTLHNQFASPDQQVTLPKQVSARIENLGFYNRYIDSEEHVILLAKALRTNRQDRAQISGNPFSPQNQTALEAIAAAHGLEGISGFDAVRAFVLSAS